MEINFDTGFPEPAPNTLDVGVYRGSVALRIGRDGSECLLTPDMARDVANALTVSALVAESQQTEARL